MKLDKNYKVRVTPEQSRQIQELVFKLGGNLQSGDTSVKETHLERLYVSKCLKMSFGLTEHGWSYHEGATIQADDLIALLTDLSKSAENPLQDVESTPEFEVVEPKFKVGDKVYYRAYADICVVSDVSDLGEVQIKGWREDYYNSRYFCHAAQENYEMLCKLYPHIEFEQPTTQADIDNAAVDKLAQAMKDKLAEKREQGYHGWGTCKHGDLVQLLINHVDKGDPIDVANFCAFLFARGEPLTEAVLDE